MKKYLLSFCAFFLFCGGFLFSEERIAGTLSNVDLIAVDLINDKGHSYGEHYFVINRNDFTVRVSIKLTDGSNTDDQLVKYPIIVEPTVRADLGRVLQKDLTKGASWKYEWQTQQDQ